MKYPTNLSERIRPDCEAAPWVVDEVKAMERQRGEMVAALERMLEVHRVLMPGIRYISVPDYALLNDAPLEAQAALKAARGES